jgi:phage virion morphogenesis protein
VAVRTYGPVEIDDGGALDMLARLRRVAGDQAEALELIGDALEQKVRMNFQTGTDPWGVPWAPLKVRVGQPLRDTGLLMASIDHAVTGGDTVVIGTNYGQLEGGGSIAGVHQFGTDSAGRNRNVKIPARPFFPTPEFGALPDDWRDEILGVIGDAIAEAIVAGGGAGAA